MKEFNTKKMSKLMADIEKTSRAVKAAQDHLAAVSNPTRVAEAKETLSQLQDEKNALENQFGQESAKLNKLIAEAEGRATVRMTDAYEIVTMLNNWVVNLNITKTALEGTTMAFDPNAQTFPKAYKYVPVSTVVKARYHAGAWVITDISRDVCREWRFNASFSDSAKEAIIARFSRTML